MSKILTLLLCILFLSARAQEKTPAFVRDSLDGYVEKALGDWNIPGVAVCVVKDGKIALMKSYGVREWGAPGRVDSNTLFMIGSNTKAFTATVLAMLHEDKKLSLDDKVQKWLPDFKVYDPWISKEANIRDLLCHRLGYETFQGDFMFFDSDLTAAQVMDKFSKIKPAHSFRSKWGYTNAAFGVAGALIPKVTGKTWAQLLEQRIFKPLNMDRTLARSSDLANADNRAAAHTVVQGTLKKVPYGKLENIGPAGSISSSITDLSKWVLAQLNNGTHQGKKVIPAAAIAQTRMPHSILGNGGHMFNNAHFALYGLGWFLEEYSGRQIVAHTGGVNGFVTSIALVPEEGLGIIVLTNTDANNFFEALRYEIMDAYLGLPYRNYSSVYLGYSQKHEKEQMDQLQKKRDTIASKPKTALPLAAYTGNYDHAIYGGMNIREESGKLIMAFEHHKGRHGTLEPLGGNRFLCTYSDPIYGTKVLPFTVADGKVKSLTVRVADFVENLPYEFIKK